MLERQIICSSCYNITKIEEAFLDLSLVKFIILTPFIVEH